MPYARKKRGARKPARAMGRKKGAKRHFRGRSRRGAASNGATAVPSSLSVSGPFGKNYYTRLCYTDLLQLDSVGGNIAQLTYRLNDCYDPYAGAGGHQPRFFDAFCGPNNGGAPYGSFRVFAAHAEFTLLNTDVVGDWAQMFIHWRTSQSAPIVDIEDMGEVPNMMSCSMAGGNSPSGARKLSKYVKIAPMLGDVLLKDDPSTIGSTTFSPGSLVLLDVGYVPMALVNASMYATIKITYYVQFFDQVYPADS